METRYACDSTLECALRLAVLGYIETDSVTLPLPKIFFIMNEASSKQELRGALKTRKLGPKLIVDGKQEDCLANAENWGLSGFLEESIGRGCISR